MIMYKLFVTLFILVTPMYAIKVSAYHEFTAKCMGTDFNILIDHDNEKLSAKAAAAAFAEANRLNKIFSDYIKDSEISLLSESSYSGKKIKLSDELFEVLKYSKSLHLRQMERLIRQSDNYLVCGEYPASEKIYQLTNLYFVH